MEALPDKEALFLWIAHYGGFALFFLLALGIIMLPVPEETLMVLTGILIRNGKLSLFPTALAAYFGSICGITTSYLIGRCLEKYLLERYGGWVGITPERIEIGHQWFRRFGKWTIFIGYFIPGVRHFTGLCAGMTKLEYKPFALFAYSGALLWVSSFLSIGYFSGRYWIALFKRVENLLFNMQFNSDNLAAILIFSFVFLILVFATKKYKNNFHN